ncbi:MAG: hypothetical protein V4573_11240 [Pseudomonadota bacterium]
MNSISAARPRLQQQPARSMDRQQQQSSGSGEFQPRQQGGGIKTSQSGESHHERERTPSQGV